MVSFVWGANARSPIHDHTVWGLIGVLRGAELSQSFSSRNAGLEPGTCRRLEVGNVEALSPASGDIHSVANAYRDRASVSVHVYGGDIGSTRRSIYETDGSSRSFVSGYTPMPLPNFWTVSDEAYVASIPEVSAVACRQDLIAGREIAIVDLREEGPFATGHPLFAANMPLSQLELISASRLPRRDVPIVVYDNGEGLVARGASILRGMGFTNVARLQRGLAGWREAGYELFVDVNSYSKAFGELVADTCATPCLSPQEVQTLMATTQNAVILDARRFDEYQTMSIPGGISVPGAELVLRAEAIVPSSNTMIVVNCAGRTRSLIGAQSLINAAVGNPVVALRDGTMGWTLAGQGLEHGQRRRYGDVSAQQLSEAKNRACAVSYGAGVRYIDRDGLADLMRELDRTVYRFDVRSPEEYVSGHLPGFLGVAGGQLVQETDVYAPVRGARIVLADDLGVRAHMTASWLAQMGWDVYVLEPCSKSTLEVGVYSEERLELPAVPGISASQLSESLESGTVAVIDLANSRDFVKGHIPGAWFAIRARLRNDITSVLRERGLVLTSPDGVLAHFAAVELAGDDGSSVRVLTGGTQAWRALGYPIASGLEFALSDADDVYKRPYEGVENSTSAMQAYLDWEHGLVRQLRRDGTHGFRVMQPTKSSQRQ